MSLPSLAVLNRHLRDERIRQGTTQVHIDGRDARLLSQSVGDVLDRYFAPYDELSEDRNPLGLPSSTHATLLDARNLQRACHPAWTGQASRKDAQEQGRTVHKLIEGFYNGKRDPNLWFEENATQEYKQLQRFDQEVVQGMLQSVPYRTEWSVFSEELHLHGTVDAVFQALNASRQPSYWICDWKRNNHLTSGGHGTMANPPMAHHTRCRLTRSYMQVNLYRLILERAYGMRIDKMLVVVLHEDHHSYVVYDVPQMTFEVQLAMGKQLDTTCLVAQLAAESLRFLSWQWSSAQQWLLQQEMSDELMTDLTCLLSLCQASRFGQQLADQERSWVLHPEGVQQAAQFDELLLHLADQWARCAQKHGTDLPATAAVAGCWVKMVDSWSQSVELQSQLHIISRHDRRKHASSIWRGIGRMLSDFTNED